MISVACRKLFQMFCVVKPCFSQLFKPHVLAAAIVPSSTEIREIDKNNLLGRQFLIFLPKNLGK